MLHAVYPGTFDPMTLGHLDIVKRASGLFDQMVVAVAESESKKPLFSLEERVDLIRTLVADMPNVKVEGFTGLLCDYMRSRNLQVIVRGMRPVGDFANEYQMAMTNRCLMPEVETVFLTANPQFLSARGTLVREIVKMGGDVSDFVAPAVTKALKEKLQKAG